MYVREFRIPVAVDEGATIRLTSDQDMWRLRHLSPNLVRTSTLPPTGVRGHLVYARHGEWRDYDGHSLQGAIALLEYNSGANWLRAFELGAAATVFLNPEEPAQADRWQGSQKYLTTPADLPRFYADVETSGRLRALMAKERQPVAVELRGRMRWRHATGHTVVAIIPGVDSKLDETGPNDSGLEQAVVIAAYYDASSAVPAIAPGAEQAGGISAWMELASSFAAHPPQRTVVMVATAGHFQALSGMRDFISLLRACRLPATASSDSLSSRLGRLEIAGVIGLDLSSGGRQVALVHGGAPFRVRQIPPPILEPITAIAERYERRYLGGAIILGGALKPLRQRRLAGQLPERLPVAGSVASLTGLLGLTLVTAADERAAFGSPLDLPRYVDYRSLAAQTHFVAHLVADIAADPLLKTDAGWRDSFGTLSGRVVGWGPRSYEPDVPVADAIVRVRSLGKTTMGVSADPLAMTDGEGRYELSGLEARTLYLRPALLEAYSVDPVNGRVSGALDRGPLGTGKYLANVVMDELEKQRTLVTFPCAAFTLFDLVDPRRLTLLDRVRILQAGREAEPTRFGYCLPPTASEVMQSGYHHTIGADTERTGVLFVPAETRIKAILSSGRFALSRRGLLLNASEEKPTGAGYDPGGSQLGGAHRAAADAVLLNRSRLRQLAEHGIRSAMLEALNDAAAKALSAATRDSVALLNASMAGAGRRAWALSAQAYGSILGLAADAVHGVVFFLFLLLPFCVLGERLLIASRGVRRQIVGAAAIFGLVFGVLHFCHPAFDLTLYPSLILLGFAILSLSTAVIALGMSRLNTQLRAGDSGFRALHRADTARGGVLVRSLILGVAQMRRRPWRTGLTAVTLVMLTYTITSYTSVSAARRYNSIPIRGAAAAGGTALMVRMPAFEGIDAPVIGHLAARFDGNTVATRRWYARPLQVFGPAGTASGAAAALGLSASENRVSGAASALIAGRWFAPGDDDVIILPSQRARDLGLGDGDVGNAAIRVLGRDYVLIGIVSEARFDALRDLSGEALSPLDMEVHQPRERRVGSSRDEGPVAFVHIPASQLVFLPAAVVARWGEWSRLAIDDFATSSALNLYARFEGDGSYRINTVGVHVFSGEQAVWIPLLIAALIVFNTMLGCVHERLPEIGTLNAIGLAPGHVAGLFLAEAAVYCVVSGILGMLLGVCVARLGWVYGLFPGLMVNYSSLSAVATVAAVMVVVLVSAAYPARQASRICTPGIERHWRLPRPKGGRSRFSCPSPCTA